MIFISIIILRIIVFNVSKACLINVKDRSFFETSGYRGTRGGRTLRGQFVSGKTVSRSFVYINHGKFRIVGPFTRPSQAPPPSSIYDHLASECAAPSTFLREPIGFVRERPPAAVVCPYLTATTMLTRLELVTNTRRCCPLTTGQRRKVQKSGASDNGRKKRIEGFSLLLKEEWRFYDLFETELGSLLRPFTTRQE